MKKLLLGTTAIAGALVLGLATAPQASAQAVAGSAPFNISLRGYSNQTLGIVGANRTSNTRSHDLYSDSEIHFVATGKADNGLTYGFRAEFEVDRGNIANAGRTIDENSVFFQGSWGRIEIGQQDADNNIDSVLPGRTCVGFGDGCVGSDGPFAIIVMNAKLSAAGRSTLGTGQGGNGAGAGHLIDTSDATKVMYRSPSFSGFNFNIAYTPKVGGTNVGQSFSLTKNPNDRLDGIELGVGYQGKVGSVDLDVRLAYNYIDIKDGGTTNVENVNSFGGGVGLGIGGFRIGAVLGYDGKGAYRKKDTTNRFDDPAWFAVVDADYVVGPWAVGAGFHYQTGEGSQAAAGNESLWMLGGKVAYTLAPGLRVLSELTYINYRDKDEASNSINRDAKGTVFLLTTQVRF